MDILGDAGGISFWKFRVLPRNVTYKIWTPCNNRIRSRALGCVVPYIQFAVRINYKIIAANIICEYRVCFIILCEPPKWVFVWFIITLLFCTPTTSDEWSYTCINCSSTDTMRCSAFQNNLDNWEISCWKTGFRKIKMSRWSKLQDEILADNLYCNRPKQLIPLSSLIV